MVRSSTSQTLLFWGHTACAAQPCTSPPRVGLLIPEKEDGWGCRPRAPRLGVEPEQCHYLQGPALQPSENFALKTLFTLNFLNLFNFPLHAK